MLVRDGRTQRPPNQAQPAGRARPGLHSPHTQLGVHLLDSCCWDLQDTGGSKLHLDRRGLDAFASVFCQPEPSAQTWIRGLLWRLGVGGGLRCTQKEGRRGSSQDAGPCLGGGHSVKASPFPGIYSLFIGDKRKGTPCWGQPLLPSSPPCLATLPPLCFFCATVTQGLGG